MIIFTGALSIYEYVMVDFFGYRDDPGTILLILIMVYLMQTYIEKKAQRDGTLKTCNDLSYIFINFFTTYLCFCLTRRYKVILFYCSIIVGVLGPCLLRLIDRIQDTHEISNPLLTMFKHFSDRNFYRIGSVSIMLIFYLIPSSKYLFINGHYLVSLIPVVLSLLVGLLYIFLLIECIKTRVKF